MDNNELVVASPNKKRKVEEEVAIEDADTQPDAIKPTYVLVQWFPNQEPVDEVDMWKIPTSELTEEDRDTLACMQEHRSACPGGPACDTANERMELAIKEGRYVALDDYDERNPFCCERWFSYEGGEGFMSDEREKLAHGPAKHRFKKYAVEFRHTCKSFMTNISEVVMIDREPFETEED